MRDAPIDPAFTSAVAYLARDDAVRLGAAGRER